MKRFHFELESLLRLRKQQRSLALLRQIEKRNQLHAIRGQLRDVEVQLDEMTQRQMQQFGRAIPANEFLLQAQFSERLRIWADEVRENERKSEIEYQQAAAEHARLSTAVEALQTIRNTRWNELKLMSARSEQRRLDETAMRRWRHRDEVAEEVCEK